MTGFEVCKEAKEKLSAAGCYNANEINSLFYTATGRSRFESSAEQLDEEKVNTFFSLVNRRISGEPLQYLCREWPFLDFTVRVDERALIPRPETELLAERSIKCAAAKRPSAILDLCSGSGVLAIAMKKAYPDAEVTAVELSAEACSLIKENAELCDVNLNIICMDAIAFVNESESERFDLVVCNPPYITPDDYKSNYDELRFEPKMAFVGGDDGLFFYEALTSPIYRILKKGGHLTYEIGNDQGEQICRLLRDAGYTDIQLLRDYADLDRNTIAMRP